MATTAASTKSAPDLPATSTRLAALLPPPSRITIDAVDRPLAEVFRAIAPRERRHTELGITGLAKIAATEEGRASAREAIAYWQPRVADSFGTPSSARFETLRRFGLRHRPNEALLADWTQKVRETLAPLGLN